MVPNHHNYDEINPSHARNDLDHDQIYNDLDQFHQGINEIDHGLDQIDHDLNECYQGCDGASNIPFFDVFLKNLQFTKIKITKIKCNAENNPS